MAYSKKVLDHYNNPRNVGKMDKEDPTVGTGMVGAPACGDVMQLQIKVKDDEIIKIDQIDIKAMYTPGHTSDSYSFLMDNYLFSGDTLLINGTGRTDFQNGNSKDAYNSIFNRLLKLPEDTILYPGHDYNGKESSTIGNEKKFNPRLQVKNVDEYVELMSNLNLAKPQLIDINVSRNIKLGAN